MKQVVFSPEIQRSPAKLALLDRLTSHLDQVIGPQSSPLIKASWELVIDYKDRELYRLTICDFTGSVSEKFAPDELVISPYLTARFYQLWGDLLQVRNNHEHGEVQRLARQLVTEQ